MEDRLRIDTNRRKLLKFFMLGGCLAASGISWPPIINSSECVSHRARFFRSVEGSTVQCMMCFRQCLIEDGRRGHCGVRFNQNGVLRTCSYGNPGAIHLDPIEKKPLFHVRPGSMAFSIATPGCNLNCKFCQNWQIAKANPEDITTQQMMPDDIAREAGRTGAAMIAYTYSEPTVWSEYVMDCAKAGKQIGIDSVVVSNGTWHPGVLDELLPLVKAIKVDLKSIDPAYYRDVCEGELQPVLENLKQIKRFGRWLEIVNLVVPSLNDSRDSISRLVEWVLENLGPDVPLHFTRFHPMYKLKNLPPTPVSVLDTAWKIARDRGIHYPYIGNVPGHEGQHTVCARCHTRVIERIGFAVKQNLIRGGKCPSCNAEIPGIWS